MPDHLSGYRNWRFQPWRTPVFNRTESNERGRLAAKAPKCSKSSIVWADPESRKVVRFGRARARPLGYQNFNGGGMRRRLFVSALCLGFAALVPFTARAQNAAG